MSSTLLIADRYSLEQLDANLVGRGGMGDVYRGIDLESNRPVAVKILKSNFVYDNPSIVNRFVREGQALSQLNHPNIVKLLAMAEENGQHFLVMEFVSGGSLRDTLDQQSALPMQRVLQIGLELADALTRAHHLNIIHRDLKPANVLLAQDGTPRLTDFGLAYVSDSSRLTKSGMLVGTMDYLSPEACDGRSLDGRTDIWAFGIILFEMLTGRRPFGGETIAAIVANILSAPVPDLGLLRSETDDGLADLIYRMLQKDPQQRIPSIRLVGAELEAIIQGSAIRPTNVGLHRSASPNQYSNRFATPASAQVSSLKHNLPNLATPFVGRQAALAKLEKEIGRDKSRLFTILGAGGIGKTRLALETGKRLLGSFEHGVYFIPLSSLNEADEIIPALAEALGFTFYEQELPRQQLLDYLREKEMLLLLDSFDHLLDASRLINDILLVAPGVQIVTTSRERLKLSQEQTFPLHGFAIPEGENLEALQQYSAVELFLQSARRVQPGFELTEDNQADLIEICRLVQGMPLGIILAAAWVEVLTPAEIADEISRNLDFLETDQRDMPERHRSVRAVFESSWNMLTERERDVFQQLSVFRGGFTRQASQEVTNASLRELMGLTNKSLLYRHLAGRYSINRLLRQYASERLAEQPQTGSQVEERHSAYYSRMLAQWTLALQGGRQQEALDAIESEIRNARAAWDWAVDQSQADYLEQSINPLLRYYEWRGRYSDGAGAAQGAIQALQTNRENKAQKVALRAHYWLGRFRNYLGDTEAARQSLDKSLQLLQELKEKDEDLSRDEARLLLALSQAELQAGSRKQAEKTGRESLSLFKIARDEWGQASASYTLGQVAWNLGHYEQAQELYQTSLRIYKQLGDRRGIADALRALGLTLMYQGQFAKTADYMNESNAIRKEIGDHAGRAVGLGDLGSALMVGGQFPQARVLLQESVAIYNNLGFRQAAAHWSTLYGLCLMSMGELELAQEQARRGLQLARDVRYQRGIALTWWLHGCLSQLEGRWNASLSHFSSSIEIYREIGQRDELAWALAGQSASLLATDQIDEAVVSLLEALQIAFELKAFLPLMFALPAAALLVARIPPQRDEDQNVRLEQAQIIFALAARHPTVANSYYLGQLAGKKIAAQAAELPDEVTEAAQNSGQQADLWETVSSLQEQLLRLASSS